MSDVGAWEPAPKLGPSHAQALDVAAAEVAEDALRVDDAVAARLRQVFFAQPMSAQVFSTTSRRHASLAGRVP